MIAKLVVWDTDRNAALRQLAMALSRYRVAGLTTNIDFLYNIATSEPFRKVELDTRFIEEHATLLFGGRIAPTNPRNWRSPVFTCCYRETGCARTRRRQRQTAGHPGTATPGGA